MTISSKTIKALLTKNFLLCHAADRWIDLGERAQAAGDAEKLAMAGAALSKLPGGGALNDASAFYSALALNRSQASRAQAEAILGGIASSGSALFRAKALLALGTNYLSLKGDEREASAYYERAARVNPDSAIVAFMIRSQQATLLSIRGDYQRALRDFEALRPLAAHVGARLPFYWPNYLNSLAVAHCDAGNFGDAEALARAAISSPLARPEFHETLDEIGAAREKRNRLARASEERRKGVIRAELRDLLITPQPDRWQADGLQSVLSYARQIEPR